MHKANIEIIELTPKDFDRAANLLAEAFYNNPSHVYIFPNNNNRLRLLQWGLKANLKLNLAPPTPIGQSFALVEPERFSGIRQLKAMGFWHPPKCGSLGLINKLISGWAIAPWKFGKASYRRLMEVMEAMNQIEKQVLDGQLAWFLNNMAVAKESRGMGVGTRVLQQQLETVVKPFGLPAILMTQKEANVRFYRQLGFEIADKSVIGSGNNAFTNWCLIWYPDG